MQNAQDIRTRFQAILLFILWFICCGGYITWQVSYATRCLERTTDKSFNALYQMETQQTPSPQDLNAFREALDDLRTATSAAITMTHINLLMCLVISVGFLLPVIILGMGQRTT